MPTIGYGSNKKTKHLTPRGLYRFVVSNVKVGVYIKKEMKRLFC